MVFLLYYTFYASPLGPLLLTAREDALTGLWVSAPSPEHAVFHPEHPILTQASTWLDGYFRGENLPVPCPLRPEGTAFQTQVWKLLLAIPWGAVRSYGDIAREMAILTGKEKMSAQAVGNAVGKNPISILIPCHRVVGTRGQLTGYGGGLEKKVWLLTHEGWTIGSSNAKECII